MPNPRRYLRWCGATENEIADGFRYINDLLGQTKKPKEVTNTDGSTAQAAESHARINVSYDPQYVHLQSFRAFAGNV